MKTTKKKPAKKPKPKTLRLLEAEEADAAVDAADVRMDQCAAAHGTEKLVLLTLEKFVRQQRAEFVKFIITDANCKDPAFLAYRFLLVTKWLELKTRGGANPKSK